MNRNSKANIGELLLRQGIIDEDQLKHAMSEQERTGIMLSKILVRLGMVSEETLTNILGVQMQSTTKCALVKCSWRRAILQKLSWIKHLNNKNNRATFRKNTCFFRFYARRKTHRNFINTV